MPIPTFPPSGAGFPSVEANIPSFPPSAAALNPLWPFPDIALPEFLWRPDITGNYLNQGSAGAALNLIPDPNNVGVPPGTFNQGWVISNPSGSCSVVATPFNPDISELGSVWSMIIKCKLFGTQVFVSLQSPNVGPSFIFQYNSNSFLNLMTGNNNGEVNVNGTTLLTDGVKY